MDDTPASSERGVTGGRPESAEDSESLNGLISGPFMAFLSESESTTGGTGTGFAFLIQYLDELEERVRVLERELKLRD